MSYKIKQVPEDFMVREIMETEPSEGRFGLYKLTKKTWTTQSAVSRVARAFHKRPKFVNFSGNKDKMAVTEQLITILHGPSRGLELDEGNIRLDYLGRTPHRINLGTSPGNRFEITVRDLEKGHSISKPEQVPNYFDEQRFGMNRNNHLVGRAMLRRDFQEACTLVPETTEWLSRTPNDYVGALRSMPRRVLRIYAHAYQSWLWNETVQVILRKSPHREVEWIIGNLVFPNQETDNKEIPIAGYDTGLEGDSGGIISGILEEEGFSLEDFRVKQFPEFDLTGSSRTMFCIPEGLEISEPEPDELNKGKEKRTVAFALQKGSYATMVVRAIFS